MVRGWWFLASCQGRAIIFDLPSIIHNWKSRFFFVYFDFPIGINWVWGEPYLKLNKNDEVLATDKGDSTHC